MMSRARSTAAKLAELFDAALRPIYLVGDDRRIVFHNQACAAWTGMTEGQLLGMECRYHSRGDRPAAETIAAGLCPPPDAFAGVRTTGAVHGRGAEEAASQRRAEFIPFEVDSDGGFSVLVLVEPDAPDAGHAVDPAEDDDALLHDRLRRVRQWLGGRYHPDSLVGVSPASARARRQVALTAAADVHVLLVGPPGSGRQHIARTIHYSRPGGAVGPFVPLACPLLGADLLSTTIASLASMRAVEATKGPPTLLLTDIDQLQADAQLALIERLDSPRAPLRVMATASASLMELVERGEFRRDLAFALSAVTIDLPPLVERLEDLPLLSQAFLEDENARGAKQVGGFSPQALDRLAAYAWPGGLDELAAMIKSAHARAEQTVITPDDLPEQIALAAEVSAVSRKTDEPIVLEKFLAEVEMELIQRALARAKGNKTKAARLLGMTRPRFYRRLVQLGLIDP